MAKAQLQIPGTEAPQIKQIEEAAEAYTAIRDRRMKLTDNEITAKAALMTIVQEHQHELSKNEDGDYIYKLEDGRIVIYTHKDNVKVKAVHDEKDEDDD